MMNDRYYNISYAESPFGTLNEFMTKTFSWMCAGLLATFAVALATAVSGAWVVLSATGLIWLLLIAELVMVIVLSARVTKLQPGTATGLFFGYAVLNGVNLSTVFVSYNIPTLVLAFLIGALYFGIMAVYGWRTENSLASWGPKLMGGLVTLLIVGAIGGLLSLFGVFSFGLLDVVYCAIALLLFMGLTAYDTQMLKHHYAYFGGDAAMLHKASIIGALNLYLDFINIFLYVLRRGARKGVCVPPFPDKGRTAFFFSPVLLFCMRWRRSAPGPAGG